MGIFDTFRQVTQPLNSSRPVIKSPWSTGSLSPWVIADILGVENRAVTRADAMRVPAIVKGRALIAGTLSRFPLACYRLGDKIETPAWLYRSAGPVNPSQRMLWTLDDLIFYGVSLWMVERGTRDQITDAVRVLPEFWEVTPDLEVRVNGETVSPEQVILFEGPQDGLLDIAAVDIRSSLAMRTAWSSRVTSPVPLVELHDTDPNAELTDDEIDALISQWEAARKSGGATGYTPARIEARIHGAVSSDLFIEGRNASRLDFANYLNIPASLLEGSMSTASLTYSTQEGRRNELADYSLSYWAEPLEARLSMDDVTPRGTRVAFDWSEWLTPTQPGTAPVKED